VVATAAKAAVYVGVAEDALIRKVAAEEVAVAGEADGLAVGVRPAILTRR
jgi:hypothetical protein